MKRETKLTERSRLKRGKINVIRGRKLRGKRKSLETSRMRGGEVNFIRKKIKRK